MFCLVVAPQTEAYKEQAILAAMIDLHLYLMPICGRHDTIPDFDAGRGKRGIG
jgi:hypothetical protein